MVTPPHQEAPVPLIQHQEPPAHCHEVPPLHPTHTISPVSPVQCPEQLAHHHKTSRPTRMISQTPAQPPSGPLQMLNTHLASPDMHHPTQHLHGPIPIHNDQHMTDGSIHGGHHPNPYHQGQLLYDQ